MENTKKNNRTSSSAADSDDDSNSVFSIECSSIDSYISADENHIEMKSTNTNPISAPSTPKSKASESELFESTHNPLALQTQLSDIQSEDGIKKTASSDGSNEEEGTPDTSSPSDSRQTNSNDDEIHNPMVRRSLSLDLESNTQLPEPIVASIADRIRQNRELILAKKQPDQLDNQNHFYSYLTPDGLYQYNSEHKKFIAVLDQAALTELGLANFMTQASYLDENTELKLNDKLAIKQWQALENKVQAHNGFSTFGYSINEEVFLRFWGHVFQLGYLPARLAGYDARDYTYPPRRDDLEKILLNWTQNELVQDVMISIRTGAQAQLVLGFLIEVYFQFFHTNNSEEEDALFLAKNMEYLLSFASAVTFLSFIALHNCYINRNFSESALHRLRLIMESIVGNIENWNNYVPIALTPLAVCSNSSYTEVMMFGLLPVILYGLYRGVRTKDTRYESYFINVDKNTPPKVAYYALSYALTESSFSLLSINLLMNSIGYYHKNTADPQVLKQYNDIFDIIRYSVTSFIFSANLVRYPKANKSLQSFGMYACNTINGFSLSMLDSYAFFFLFLQILVVSTGGDHSNPQNSVFNTFYFGLQALTLLASITITFPNCKNLPILSIESMETSNSSTSNSNKLCKGLSKKFNFFPSSQAEMTVSAPDDYINHDTH